MAAMKSVGVIAVAMLGLFAMTMALAQEAASVSDLKIKELQKEKLNLLQQRYDECVARHDKGMIKTDILYNAEFDLLKCKLQQAIDKQERVDLLTLMLKNRQKLEDAMSQRYKNGTLSDTADRLLSSVQRIDVEIALAEEQAKP